MGIADVQAHRLTGPGGRYEGRQIKLLVWIKGSMDERTGQLSYRIHAKANTMPTWPHSEIETISFWVPANDTEALRTAFKTADADGVFIELMAMEPVMGEGNPGQQLLLENFTMKPGSFVRTWQLIAGRLHPSRNPRPGLPEHCGLPRFSRL